MYPLSTNISHVKQEKNDNFTLHSTVSGVYANKMSLNKKNWEL